MRVTFFTGTSLSSGCRTLDHAYKLLAPELSDKQHTAISCQTALGSDMNFSAKSKRWRRISFGEHHARCQIHITWCVCIRFCATVRRLRRMLESSISCADVCNRTHSLALFFGIWYKMAQFVRLQASPTRSHLQNAFHGEWSLHSEYSPNMHHGCYSHTLPAVLIAQDVTPTLGRQMCIDGEQKGREEDAVPEGRTLWRGCTHVVVATLIKRQRHAGYA